MNRLAWHIPLGILISVSAHLSLVTVINGGAYWPFRGDPKPAAYEEALAQTSPEASEMEIYPTFRDSDESAETILHEPVALPGLPESQARQPTKTPGLKIERVEKFPVLFE